MTASSKPRFTIEVFHSLTGEFHPCLVNRSGRIVWQGSGCHTRAEALASAQCERTARWLRMGVSPCVEARA